MSMVERSVEVHVPVTAAYNQWTQFEDFPLFMQEVERVEQLDDTTLRWRARMGGKVEEWTAKIAEQIPDKRIAWHSVEGAKNSGVVTFHRLDEDRTRVMLQMAYEPATGVEKVADWLGSVARRVDGDLERFKEFMEARGVETGSWRGHIPDPDERRSS